MRFASVDLDGVRTAVSVEPDTVRPLRQSSLTAALEADPDPAGWELGDPIELDGEPEFLEPLRPGKVVAIGLNYFDHIRETGMDKPANPLVFAKFPSSVIGPADAIVLPAAAPDQVDWEVELGVVVSKKMSAVPVDEALGSVLGYTVANDVSARDAQMGDGQWTRSKSFDTFCPIGPEIVTADEVPDPQALALRTRVDGETVQNSNTAEMIFSVAELLSYCSASFTLYPGDLVLTGTPWGCGAWMDPPRALVSGNVLESEVEGIGVMRNPVRKAY